jgi:hypothetical protein
MPYTLSYFVFYLVVLSQVLLLSFYLPRTVLRRLRRVIDEHPPSTYPKLYPMSIEVVESGLRRYRIMNLLILLAGLALVFAGIYAPSADMLNWDNQAVLALYACLQFSPMLLVERSGLKYYRLMRTDATVPEPVLSALGRDQFQSVATRRHQLRRLQRGAAGGMTPNRMSIRWIIRDCRTHGNSGYNRAECAGRGGGSGAWLTTHGR